MKKDISKSLKKALLKKAMGYTTTEVIEEYSNGEEGMVLQKKKVTSKDIPPDLASFKALVELSGGSELENMSEEDLLQERDRLIKLIQNEKENV